MIYSRMRPREYTDGGGCWGGNSVLELTKFAFFSYSAGVHPRAGEDGLPVSFTFAVASYRIESNRTVVVSIKSWR